VALNHANLPSDTAGISPTPLQRSLYKRNSMVVGEIYD